MTSLSVGTIVFSEVQDGSFEPTEEGKIYIRWIFLRDVCNEFFMRNGASILRNM